MIDKTNNKHIIQYLNYLKDISRKISINVGLENVLVPKRNRRTIKNRLSAQLKDDLKEASFVLPKDKFLDWLIYLNRNIDKRLFLGAGLICGTYRSGSTEKIIAAPLLIAECNIYEDDKQDKIICDIDTQKIIINYDLISYILEKNQTSSVEEEYSSDFIIKLEKESKIIDEVERIVDSIEKASDIEKLTIEIFTKLQDNLEEFKNIKIYNNHYDYEEEKEKLQRKEPSIFSEEKLVFVNAYHLFIETAPNELSSYESLAKLVKEIEEVGRFENKTVEKLLNGAFSEDHKIYFGEEINESIKELLNFMPINLSTKQKEALINAFSSEISYIQGPPGTGKSHTILALILLSVLLGKKVLIVSQKTPALEVIDEKIRPFLKPDNDLLPVVYYSKDIKSVLKASIRQVVQLGSREISLEQRIKEIKMKLSEIEKKLKEKINRKLEDESKLSKDIELEKKIYDLTTELESLLNSFKNKYYFKIKKIR